MPKEVVITQPASPEDAWAAETSLSVVLDADLRLTGDVLTILLNGAPIATFTGVTSFRDSSFVQVDR